MPWPGPWSVTRTWVTEAGGGGAQRPHPDGRHAQHQAPRPTGPPRTPSAPGPCWSVTAVRQNSDESDCREPAVPGLPAPRLPDTPEGAWRAPNGETGPRSDSPNRREEILLWAYMVKPSFSQNSPQVALVTRFPNQL